MIDWNNDSQIASNLYKTSLEVRDIECCFIGKTNSLLIQNYQVDGHWASWWLGKKGEDHAEEICEVYS